MKSKTWTNINEELYAKDNYTRYTEVYNFIIQECGSNKLICDLGCGDGSLGELLLRNKNLVYGIESVKTQADIASTKGINTYIADLNYEKLSFESCFFDVVIATEVIEHLLNPDNLLKEAYRILKNDGIFIVTTPNLASLGRRLFLLLGKNPVIEVSPKEENAVGHLRYFVKESLSQLLKKHKFLTFKFTSDVINFDKRGMVRSSVLAKIFPVFGRTLICVCKKII